jgi:hypothetical protein
MMIIVVVVTSYVEKKKVERNVRKNTALTRSSTGTRD